MPVEVCSTCGTGLAGGRDTFGPWYFPLCFECRLFWWMQEEGIEDTPRYWYWTPDSAFTSWGGFPAIPAHVAACPECAGVVCVEINEWESATGIPTDGGILAYCGAEGFDPLTDRHDHHQCDWGTVQNVVVTWLQDQARIHHGERVREAATNAR